MHAQLYIYIFNTNTRLLLLRHAFSGVEVAGLLGLVSSEEVEHGISSATFAAKCFIKIISSCFRISHITKITKAYQLNHLKVHQTHYLFQWHSLYLLLHHLDALLNQLFLVPLRFALLVQQVFLAFHLFYYRHHFLQPKINKVYLYSLRFFHECQFDSVTFLILTIKKMCLLFVPIQIFIYKTYTYIKSFIKTKNIKFSITIITFILILLRIIFCFCSFT